MKKRKSWKAATQIVSDLKNIQGANGNWNHSEYMRGMYNGFEVISCTLEERESKFKTEQDMKLSKYGSGWEHQLDPTGNFSCTD